MEDFRTERWAGIDRENVIELALFKSNMSMGIGTSIAVGEASLVLVQTAASNERATEVVRRSDLTRWVRSTAAYCVKLRAGLTSVTNVDFML